MQRSSIHRHVSQSNRYRASALRELRQGHWQRAEELLWGSLAGAVKAVAGSRGVELKDDAEMKSYLALLSKETRNRRIRDAFNQLSNFSTLSYTVEDSRSGRDRLYQAAERVSYAVEKLWELLPDEEGFQR